MFLFIFVSNWLSALLPWKFIQLHHEELVVPTNDINTIVALDLITSVAYFFAGLCRDTIISFIQSKFCIVFFKSIFPTCSSYGCISLFFTIDIYYYRVFLEINVLSSIIFSHYCTSLL